MHGELLTCKLFIIKKIIILAGECKVFSGGAARSRMALGYSLHIYNFAIIKNALILLSGYSQLVCIVPMVGLLRLLTNS